MDVIVEDLPGGDRPAQSPQAAVHSEPVAHLALASRFSIGTPTREEEKKLAEVWTYAQGIAKSEDMQDVIWEVIHLEGVLGSPRLGESRLDRLYRYIRLKRQEAQIQEDLKNVSLNGRLR